MLATVSGLVCRSVTTQPKGGRFRSRQRVATAATRLHQPPEPTHAFDVPIVEGMKARVLDISSGSVMMRNEQ